MSRINFFLRIKRLTVQVLNNHVPSLCKYKNYIVKKFEKFRLVNS